MKSVRLLCLAAAIGSVASAQSPPDTTAIVRIEGQATVNDQPAQGPATLPATSLIRTTDGRVQVRLRGGVLLSLGPKSAIRVTDNRPLPVDRLEMIGGTAVVTTGAGGAPIVCEDAIKLSDAGVFTFDLRPISYYGENECRFRVYQGAASVQLATVQASLTAGKTMGVNRRCGDMIPIQNFDTAEIDDLYRWAAKR